LATDHVKIGLLLPSTGVDSTQGTDTAKGFELYLKQISGRAGGREIRLVKEDDQAKPDVALVKIKKLVEVDRVDFLIGPIITPIYITRTQKQDGRIVNAVIDTIPSVSQEATWGWWNKS